MPAAPSQHLLVRAARGERVERAPVWAMRQAGRWDPEFRRVRDGAEFFAFSEDVEKSATKAKEAAATLEEIQKARDSDRPGGSPRPSPPRGAGVPEAAAPAPVTVAPIEQRRRYDQAMRTLQGD